MHCGMRSPVSPLNGESVHENISIDGACAPGAKREKRGPPAARAPPTRPRQGIEERARPPPENEILIKLRHMHISRT